MDTRNFITEFAVPVDHSLEFNEYYIKRLALYNRALNEAFQKLQNLNVENVVANVTITNNLIKRTAYISSNESLLEKNKIYTKQKIELDRFLKFAELLRN